MGDRDEPRPWGVAGAAAACAALLLTGCAAGGLGPVSEQLGAPAAAPELEVQTVVDGLSNPWDVALTPEGTALVTERGGRLLAHDAQGTREVAADLDDVFVGSEAGLMGLAVSPEFGRTREFFLCHATRAEDGGPRDVRVTRWRLDGPARAAERTGTVVDGLPISSGRHSGCRLRFAPDGTLRVGTGDAAQGENPQDPGSLGGKTLRLHADGTVPDDNPFADRQGSAAAVYTLGHRNVQGLAVQPGTGTLWSAEHGPGRDDEINELRPGGNYGWDPVPGYDESTPMTDLEKFPDAVEAAWSSGRPTVAVSGAAFLEGPQWGAWDGALAVAELKNTGVGVYRVEGTGITGTTRMRELENDYGRLRSLTLDEDGALWVTTSNGDDDAVLRVTARAAEG
ncbi:PQQ-dependent sugar dehydrogenase [Kocuria turfanensis]|uniref:Glucose dehydrogenase n=1 Tax=Kocuria turfanensis TaxID=388357 RepID=A0A512IF13_9MICC|nr:PQQ-dependent sugar dehydrogenase [Kocuria turfanensis]GEO96247.1 glucose dehydrogenase [Kocuria turfanensis]